MCSRAPETTCRRARTYPRADGVEELELDAPRRSAPNRNVEEDDAVPPLERPFDQRHGLAGASRDGRHECEVTSGSGAE